MIDSFRADYLAEAQARFRGVKKLSDGAIAQLQPNDFFTRMDPDSNSVAQIVKHMAGNMRSRFTDWLNADGEKPDRQRDSEFQVETDSQQSLLAAWERDWALLLDAVAALSPADLDRRITIRGQPHSIVEALNRSLAHLAMHGGQIVMLAKHFRSDQWRTLSIPRGESEEFNEALRARFGTNPPAEPK